MQVDQLTELLDGSGLLTADEARTFLESLPAESRPSSGEALLAALVAAEKLTEYQASVLREGTTKGLVLGEYTLLAKIGAGGMGQVYQAHHRRLKRIVALKILPPSAVDSESAIARFQQEMVTMAKLDHPHVVIAHDAGEADGIHFLVMQLIDGEDLSAVLTRRSTLPVAEAVSYIAQAAKGLAYAHGEGVIHRDLKPANLLVDKNGTVKVLDMGLARLTNTAHDAATDDQLTGTGQIMGTVDYMSPEQALNTKKADHRSDIYSLGCTLHALLIKRPLFEGESVVEKIIAHREQPVRSLAEDRNDIPPQLDAIFMKMVAKRPEDRYQTMAEVVEQLTNLQQQVPLSTEKATASDATITSLGDPTHIGSNTDGQKTVGQGATVTMVERDATPPGPAQQDTLSSYRTQEETHSNLQTSTSKNNQHRSRNSLPKYRRRKKKLLPLFLVLAVLAAAGYFLSQEKYRTELSGLFRSANKMIPDNTPPASDRSVDLLEFVDVGRDSITGQWKRAKDTLTSPDASAARIEISYLPPKHYDLTIVAEPVAGNAGLVVGLLADGQQVSAVLGLQGSISGLATNDSFEFPDPSTQHDGQIFSAGKPTTILCKVRERRITIQADGNTIIDYQGSLKHLRVYDLWRVPNDNVLFLGSAVSSYRITSLVLEGINAAGKPIDKPSK